MQNFVSQAEHLYFRMTDSCLSKYLVDLPEIACDYELPREYFTLLGGDAYRNVKDNLYGNVDRTVTQSREFSVKCACTPADGCGLLYMYVLLIYVSLLNAFLMLLYCCIYLL